MNRIIKISLVIILFVACTSQLYSQEEVYPDKRYGYISIGSHFQMWRVKGYSRGFSQIVFPISLMMPFGKNFNLSIRHVPAMSWWYEEYRLFGLSDTWVQGNYMFLKNRVMVNVGVGLPTGKTRLNNTEYYISKLWLQRNLLRFPLPVYGQGFSTKAGFAMAWPILDNIVIGLGGQYIYHAAFNPVEYEYSVQGVTRVADKEYLPGDEASGHVGFDFQVGENLKIMVDGIYTYYFLGVAMWDKTRGSIDRWSQAHMGNIIWGTGGSGGGSSGSEIRHPFKGQLSGDLSQSTTNMNLR